MTKNAPPGLVLASASPARAMLLKTLGITPEQITAADIDETVLRGETPGPLVLRLAEAKARTAAARFPQHFILAADTIIWANKQVLGKPENRVEAETCLKRLSGRRHRVYSGVALLAPDGTVRTKHACTIVAFKRLEPREIKTLLDSEEWQGRSGGYAIQGRAGGFIRLIRGSSANVAGLPLFETRQLLATAGLMPF